MSIAAKCICGESLYYCVGGGKCPYRPQVEEFMFPLSGIKLTVRSGGLNSLGCGFNLRLRETTRQQDIIDNLISTTVIMPK